MLDLFLVFLESALYVFLAIALLLTVLAVVIGVPIYAFHKAYGFLISRTGRRATLDELLERVYNPAIDPDVDYYKLKGESQLDRDANIYSLTFKGDTRASR